MQLAVSTFADVYLRTFQHHKSQFVIWDPMRGILSKTKTVERNKQLGQIQT